MSLGTRTFCSVLAALAFALVSGCGSSAAGSHSYVYEDDDEVRYIEWDASSGDDSLAGSWEGVVYDPRSEAGTGVYRDALAGRVDGDTVTLDPAEDDLAYTGKVGGGELALEWGGGNPGGRTYSEGSRGDYEEAMAGLRERALARVGAERARAEVEGALADAEGVVSRDLHGVAVADSSIEAIAGRLGEKKAEIDGLAALNERENEENRRLAAEWDPKWDEPDLCKTSDDGELAGEVTYLDFAVRYDPEEARAEYDVELLEEKVEEKREAIAGAEEALSDAGEVPEGARERLDALRARVEEDAEKVAELDRLVEETNGAYRIAGPKNEEAIDEYQRIRKDACVRD